MNAFKRIMIACDGSELDNNLMEFASFLQQFSNIEQIYFIHVVKSLDLPKEVAEKYPDLIAPIDEGIERNIKQTIETSLQDASIPYEILIREGNVAHTLLKAFKQKEVDLIVMGRKKQLKGTGEASSQIIKLSKRSILFIPEKFSEEEHTILVPVDFSEPSKQALEIAIDIAHSIGRKIVLQHIYHVPSGYSTIGKSYDEFAEIMRYNAEKTCKVFLQDIDSKGVEIEPLFTLKEEDEETADEISNAIKETKASVLVIGSQGRTATAAFLFGSNTDKVLQHIDIMIPTFIIKDPKNQVDIFDVLSHI